ncbi:hypothetical protein IHE61_13125 [Streptomyces sp. GKU 257-1]|nr:hypothetical protein [Streptomyces sp. GKU 257-1]
MGLQQEWSRTNSEYAENTPGFSADHGAWNKIDGAANDGKGNAREEWGDQ